jgi:hypothetical protein
MTNEELFAWVAAEGTRLDEALARFEEETKGAEFESLAERCDAVLHAIRRFHDAIAGGEAAPAGDAADDGRP